jgi:hypothetical protein
MKQKVEMDTDHPPELPDSWWYKVYVGVIVSLVVVLAALWSFSRYFSS